MRADAAEQKAGDAAASGLLAELAVHERNAIQRASLVQFCAAGEVLLRANSPSRFVLFPINTVVSIVRTLADDRAVGVGLFGSEGIVGIDVALESKSQPDQVVVQSAGFVYCMPADDLRHQFEGTGRLQKSVLRFSQAFLAQVGQNALCARYHELRQRLAKWLLMIDDRLGGIERGKPVAVLAMSLGASEGDIQGAMTELASRGAVQNRRGRIVLQRDALEVEACECYESVRMTTTAAEK